MCLLHFQCFCLHLFPFLRPRLNEFLVFSWWTPELKIHCWCHMFRAVCSVHACCVIFPFASACCCPQTAGFPIGAGVQFKCQQPGFCRIERINVSTWVKFDLVAPGMLNTSVALVALRVILNHKFVLGSGKQVESLIRLSTLLKCKALGLHAF